MEQIDKYYWAQDKIDQVTTGKEHREQMACERRLRQMQMKREKLEARKDMQGKDDV